MQLIDLTALVHIKDTNEHIFGCENSPTSLVIYLSAVFIYGLHSLSVCVCVCMYIFVCMYLYYVYVYVCVYIFVCMYLYYVILYMYLL